MTRELPTNSVLGRLGGRGTGLRVPTLSQIARAFPPAGGRSRAPPGSCSAYCTFLVRGGNGAVQRNNANKRRGWRRVDITRDFGRKTQQLLFDVPAPDIRAGCGASSLQRRRMTTVCGVTPGAARGDAHTYWDDLFSAYSLVVPATTISPPIAPVEQTLTPVSPPRI